MKVFHHRICNIFYTVVLLATAAATFAQTPDEHASHHPDKNGIQPSGSAKDSASSMPAGKAGGMGGMMEGMGEMMEEMMKEKDTDERPLYPSMMQLSEMSPEMRIEIRRLADKQVADGNDMLEMGLKHLKGANRNHDIAGMSDATEQIRRGKIMLESGLEGQRALSENIDPRLTALQWFRREMNLPAPDPQSTHGFFGLSWFHYVTMFLFVAFAMIMIWMYFHKMKRANALIEKLAGKSAAEVPPPGNKPDGPIPASTIEPKASGEPANTDPAAAKKSPPIVSDDIAPSKPNSWTGTLLVAEIFDETPNVKTFRLVDPEGGKIPFNYLPGQFITVTINPKGVPVKRSYTIASSPTNRDYCEITVKHEEKGTVSHYMHTEVHIGELMQFTAPSGKFTFTEAHAESAVFIAGGVGITPMMSAIRYLTDKSWKGDIYLFFACKNQASIIFKEEILYLQKRYPNFHVFFILSKPTGKPSDSYISGHLTKEILNGNVPDITNRMIHICGPPPMMDAVKKMLEELKVPKEMVMVEAFAGPPPVAKAATGDAKNDVADAARNSAAEPKGNAPAAAAAPSSPAGEGAGTVTFAKSNKTAVLTPDKTILEASEEAGVNIDYSCRVGTCGICKTKLISGKVTMAIEDALTEEDKGQNMILACQAKATGDVSVDA